MTTILLTLCLLAAGVVPSGERIAQPLGSWLSVRGIATTNVLVVCRLTGFLDINSEFTVSRTGEFQCVMLAPKDTVYARRLTSDELGHFCELLRDSGVLRRAAGAQSYLDGGNWECQVHLDGATNHLYFNANETMTDHRLERLSQSLYRMAWEPLEPANQQHRMQRSPSIGKSDPAEAQPVSGANGHPPAP